MRGMTTKEEDVVEIFLTTTTHQELLFFTNQGRVFSIKAYEIPATTRTAKGQALPNFLELGANETVTAVQALPSASDSADYLIMATRGGVIKKTPRQDFANIRRSGLRAITLKGDDALEWVGTTTGKDEIFLATTKGQAIRFKEQDIRPMGRTASGVRGIKLGSGDMVVSMHVVPASQPKQEVMVITEHGFGKRTPVPEYRIQKRGGTGIKTANVTKKTGQVVTTSLIATDDLVATDIFIISEKGQVIRIAANTVSQLGRSTQGVRVMRADDTTGNVAAFTAWIDPKA